MERDSIRSNRSKAAKLLIDPASAGQIAGGAVLAYSLTATAVRHLRASGAGA
jgi:hypothetical protein